MPVTQTTFAPPLPPPPPVAPPAPGMAMPAAPVAPLAPAPAYRPDAWNALPVTTPAAAPLAAPVNAMPSLPAGATSAIDGLKAKGQALLANVANAIFPLKPAAQPGIQAVTLSPIEKVKQVARSAVFFALPVGGAAVVACGLGWLVGPFVPFVGGHVFGAVAATLLVGHTAGGLLHGAMRLPLVTRPEDRELNSAGATIASGALGVGFAWAIAAAAGASVTPLILLAGAAAGAAPRIMEWMGGKAVG